MAIDLDAAIAVYIFAVLAAVSVAWVRSRRRLKKELFLDERFIWFCSICTYTYINTKGEHISMCPRCGSYNKKSEKH
jgi:rubrerythrin